MPEYIERAKVAEFFEKNKKVMWHKDDVAATVSSKSIPAADVVEVVRCRECKHRKDRLYCRLRKQPVIVTNNDFCSYGERKEAVNA